MKNSTVALIAALTWTSAVILHEANAQEATPPKAETIVIPKTKGAYMLVPIQPNPLVIPFSNAQACEDEKKRIMEAEKLNSFCIWVK